MSGIEGVATVVSIVGFSAQIFDGCFKGSVLLSTAHNLGRDADMFRCMLDWEQFRLEQWAEKVHLSDPSSADSSLDWELIETTLEHIRNLTNDTAILKKKYGLTLHEDSDSATLVETSGDAARMNSFGLFKKLFSSDKSTSSATARVIQSRNHPMKKLWWAAVDRNDFKRLIDDISLFTQRLYDLLNSSVQDQLKKSIDTILHSAIPRSENVLDLAVMRQLARLPDLLNSCSESQEELEERIAKQSQNLLFWAVESEDVKEIEQLLDDGVNIESKDFAGLSPLIRAADNGRLASTNLLLCRGADPYHGTIGHRIPLHFAAQSGHLGVVESLLESNGAQINAQDDLQQTPLHKALKKDRKSFVKYLLLQKGIKVDTIDKDGFSPLTNAIFTGDSDIVRGLLEFPDIRVNHKIRDNEQTPLWMSVTADENSDILQQLLARADIDINQTGRLGETPLLRAARWSRNTALELLLRKQADYNLPQQDGLTPLAIAARENNEGGVALLLQQPHIEPNRADNRGYTPLIHAAERSNTSCIKILLKHAVDLEKADDNGRTALSQAAFFGNKIPIRLLLKAGANINTQDSSGNTPLARAVASKHDAVVRVLLENGADPDLVDEDEETPFEKARDQHMDEVVRVFQEVSKIY